MVRANIPTPGYLLSLAIAETLAERDPKFLPVLRRKLFELSHDRRADPIAVETISNFLLLLDEPRERKR